MARFPIEPLITEESDNWKPFIYNYGETPADEAFAGAIKPILERPVNRKESSAGQSRN